MKLLCNVTEIKQYLGAYFTYFSVFPVSNFGKLKIFYKI